MLREYRLLKCVACYRGCRYLHFKIWPGLQPSEVFGGMLQELKSDGWKYKRRRSILGRLHAEKLKAWKQMLAECPHTGEWLGIGDIVELWGHSSSRPGGVQHEGVVVGVVPPLMVPEEIFHVPRGVRARRGQLRGARDHESYLVQVQPGKVALLLWPPVSRVKLLF